MEEHCKRMCKIAWDNGAYQERERSANTTVAWGVFEAGSLHDMFFVEVKAQLIQEHQEDEDD